MFASAGTWIFKQLMSYILPKLFGWIKTILSDWIGKKVDDKKINDAFEKEDGRENAQDIDDVFMRR